MLARTLGIALRPELFRGEGRLKAPVLLLLTCRIAGSCMADSARRSRYAFKG